MWLHEELEFRVLSGTKVCNAANKAVSLLQLGSRTADVAATLTSHATSNERTARC